ncbi:MAG: phosphatidate cytidylyltransferase [Spirochaetaceae bacterium]|jgi:dolichol kinase|nr:phosphatidate cytidylyltransferase [Spirochaetaceae bacterium]
MKNINAIQMYFAGSRASSVIQGFKSEFVRKGIHFLIALTPALAALNRDFAVALLSSGIVFYSYLEWLRLSGIEVPFFSVITRKASRPRDKDRFVLGPVTLGAGALLSLLFLPETPAKIAIYALAFGDGFASLIGRIFGRIRPAFLLGKSLEGSFSCFFSVLIASWYVCGDVKTSFVTAVSATLCEALPLEDYDNIVIPLAAGIAAKLCLGL